MSAEASFIAALRAIATTSAARDLRDDAAVLEIGGTRLVLTMDAIVEGVHYLPDDPPETIAWKLVATNVSDLSAKGAVPRGCLLSYALALHDEWNAAFLRGLDLACRHFTIPLLGGDTIRMPEKSARSFSLVALGEPVQGVAVPSRCSAQVGDDVWMSGTVGDAGLGLKILLGEPLGRNGAADELVSAYRQPMPSATLGVALAPLVHAMMDISDGLLIDAQRLAEASSTRIELDLGSIALSPSFQAALGSGREDRLFAATAGDDYQLLFTAPPEQRAALNAAAACYDQTLTPIGKVVAGHGLSLLFQGQPAAPPSRLGYEHQSSTTPATDPQ